MQVSLLERGEAEMRCLLCGEDRGYGMSVKRPKYCRLCIVNVQMKAAKVRRGNASSKVNRAKKKGLLPKLDGSITCCDCGNPAEVYDHRDYNEPLNVEPVCYSCNWHRGPAKSVKNYHHPGLLGPSPFPSEES